MTFTILLGSVAPKSFLTFFGHFRDAFVTRSCLGDTRTVKATDAWLVVAFRPTCILVVKSRVELWGLFWVVHFFAAATSTFNGEWPLLSKNRSLHFQPHFMEKIEGQVTWEPHGYSMSLINHDLYRKFKHDSLIWSVKWLKSSFSTKVVYF